MQKFNLLKTSFLILTTTLLPLSGFTQELVVPSVNIVSAKIIPLAPVSWVSGTIVSRNNSSISAEIAGRLINLIAIGTTVKKGDIIATIDDTSWQIQLKEDQASIVKAQAQLQFLQADLKRKTTLAKENLSSINDLDQTRSQRDIAKSDLNVAKAKRDQTLQKIAYSQLKAPFDGLVTQRLSNLGEYVNTGTAIIRLVETANLEASIFAPITAYKYLAQRKSVALESPLGRSNAPIKALIPVADTRSHLMEIRLNMSQIDWPIGLSIKVAIAIGEKKAVLAVPRDALVLRRDGISIFKVTSGNKAEQISVRVGIGAGELVEVIGNVKADDKIIIRGSERIKTGQTVRIKNNNQDLISGKS